MFAPSNTVYRTAMPVDTDNLDSKTEPLNFRGSVFAKLQCCLKSLCELQRGALDLKPSQAMPCIAFLLSRVLNHLSSAVFRCFLWVALLL